MCREAVDWLGGGGLEHRCQMLCSQGPAPGRPVGSGIGGMTVVVETNFRVVAFIQVRVDTLLL